MYVIINSPEIKKTLLLPSDLNKPSDNLFFKPEII